MSQFGPSFGVSSVATKTMTENTTNGKLLSYIRALDSYTTTSSPPKPEEMDEIAGMPDSQVVIDRFGNWEKALTQVNLIRDPDSAVKIPVDIRSTVKARANRRCERCQAGPNESRGGLSVEWVEEPPIQTEDASPEDAVLVCSDCKDG